MRDLVNVIYVRIIFLYVNIYKLFFAENMNQIKAKCSVNFRKKSDFYFSSSEAKEIFLTSQRFFNFRIDFCVGPLVEISNLKTKLKLTNSTTYV